MNQAWSAAKSNTGTGEAGNKRRWPVVLQVLPSLGAGGVERGTVDMAAAIIAAGGRALVASSGGPLVRELDRLGATHVIMPVDSKNPMTMWANVSRLVELIERERIDIVHVRSRAPAWSAAAAARRTGIFLVTTIHGTYGGSNAFKRRYNQVMGRGDRVIAISTHIGARALAEYGVNQARLRIIHRGVDIERFDPDKVSAERMIRLARAWQLPDGAPIVMLPGRLTRWKGQTVFIDAIARLARRDIRCLIIGADQGRVSYRRELEAQVTRRGLAGVVRVIDECNDMPAALKLADVVVSASIEAEGFGRIAAEAQAMGRPVVATDHGGSREILLPGVTGWLVPPGDADRMAVAIDAALSLGGPARLALAEAAKNHVRSRFSKDEMCRKTIAVYAELMAERALNLRQSAA